MKILGTHFRTTLATILLVIFSANSFAQSTIKNGNCPRLDEVYTTWETISTSYKAGGGWKVPKYTFSGGITNGVAQAEKYRNCSAEISTANNPNKNRIHCGYHLVDDEPYKYIRVFKDKPDNYDCSCNSSTGQYRCVVK